jgi:hypothetical protein
VHDDDVQAHLGRFPHRRAAGSVHDPDRAQVQRAGAPDGADGNPHRPQVRCLVHRRPAGRHPGRRDAGRTTVRGSVPDRLPGPVGRRQARRLRSAGDDQRERDGRCVGRVPAAEPGPLLVPRPGQRPALRDLPRLQRLDRGLLQALSRSPQGHRHAQRGRCRGGLAGAGTLREARRWPIGLIVTRSTSASGGPRKTSGCRFSCTSERRAVASRAASSP